MSVLHIIAATCLAILLGGCSGDQLQTSLSPGDELIVITRNSPTTYYFDGDEPTGFDYELARSFAEEQGLALRVKVAFTLEELITMLAEGEGHIAAAGLTLTPERSAQFRASVPYITQKPLVIYKSGLNRPRSLEALANRDIVVLAGSSHIERLTHLAETVEGLAWREIRAADTLELMKLVTEEKAELAIVDSVEFQIQQRLYPRLVAALELEDNTEIVWYLPDIAGIDDLSSAVDTFLITQRDSGALEQLRERHFGGVEFASRMGSLTFQRKVRTVLPQWQSLIQSVAGEYQLDWRLLASVAYQESHWDPKARSRTGVRGMMMITRATAKDLGVEDRLDPLQSLRGGARFIKNLKRRLPEDIGEPDLTWMALAAYNIGLGHLEDARILTERSGLDPHRWSDVRQNLPGLQNPDVYPNTRYGFARGNEAVTYVDNIRHYLSVLQISAVPDNRIQPPVDTAALLADPLPITLPAAL